MARAWLIPSYLIVGLVVVGLGGAYTQMLSPGTGFGLFFPGVLLALLSAALLCPAAAIASAGGRSWRGQAVRGAIVPLIVVVAVFLIAGGSGDKPRINDITTDLDDPPVFQPDVAAGAGSAGTGSAGLPAAGFREQQEAGYPELGPLVVDLAPAAAFVRAAEAARAMPDWKVTLEDEATGTLQAISVSSLFHFVDDIVIRVRPEGTGSRIDLRSRSRVGQGDMGANEARIVAFQKRFTE